MPITFDASATRGITIQMNNITSNNRTALTTTALGSASVSTTNPKIGNGSVTLNGSSSISINNSLLLVNNTTQRTQEFWINTSTTSVRIYISMGNFANNTPNSWWQLYNQSNNRLELGKPGAAVTVSPNNTFIPDGTWQHIAWTTDGDNNSWYVNGNLIHTFTRTSSEWTTSTNVYVIGAQNPTAQGTIGNIDEFRVSNVVRYTANFTPQTTAFLNDNNTVLLLHMDGTNGSTSFPDDNTVITATGMSFMTLT